MNGRTNANLSGGIMPNFSADKALIHIQAQTGSEISFSESGNIIKTLTASDSIPNYDNPYFSDYFLSLASDLWGAIDIVSNYDGITDSVAITVVAAKQYDARMKLHLYKAGKENIALTGGLQGYPYKISGAGSTAVMPTVTKGESSITVRVTGSASYNAGSLFSENSIDMTPFTKICMNVTAVNGGSSGNYSIRIAPNKQNNYTSIASQEYLGAVGIKTADLTNVSGLYYAVLNEGGTKTMNITFNEWWLE